ncbi:MAG: hypothetical protein GX080_08070 [Tissierellia bacterium]|nr:hypothetical protein [Tissierellia bacterium]
MKRRFGISLLVLLLSMALLAGCSGQDNEPATGDDTKELVDGTYLIKEPVSDKGNYPMVKLVVENGEIKEFKYSEILATSGEEKNESNYKYAEGIQVIANLNEQFNEKKDLNEIDFDAVSGATHTKENFKKLTEAILEKAQKGETYEPVLKDGEYTAKAEEDSHGWLGEVKVVVRDGQIVGVDYFETAVADMEGTKVVFNEDNEPVTDEDGKPKTEEVEVKQGDRKSVENYAYLNTFEVITQMQKLIIDNNGTDNIDLDSVTGATGTRTNIVDLVNKALEGAKL